MSAADRAYEAVIGLEIHVQLATATKMFCGCGLSFGEQPNTRTCPVCLGLPGSLPVVNARAVHFGLMIGLVGLIAGIWILRRSVLRNPGPGPVATTAGGRPVVSDDLVVAPEG